MRSQFFQKALAIVLIGSALLFQATSFGQSNGENSPPIKNTFQYVDGNHPMAWKIKRDSWSSEDDKKFGELISVFAQLRKEKKCLNMKDCINHPMNPIRNPELDSQLDFTNPSNPGKLLDVDCGRMPYLLRAYFAWRMGLPFTYSITKKRLENDSAAGEYYNYSFHGNVVVARVASTAKEVVTTQEDGTTTTSYLFPNFDSFKTQLIQNVWTRTFRTAHKQEPTEAVDDLYSIEINKSNLKPGTVVYYPEGHVAVVSEIHPSGEVTTYNAHPGNFTSVQPLNNGRYKLIYEKQEWGGGLRNFRPQSLVDYKQDSEGNLVAGRLVLKLDSELKGKVSYFQAEAYKNPEFSNLANFIGHISDLVATQPVKFEIVAGFEEKLQKLCTYVKERQGAVDAAVTEKTDLMYDEKTRPLLPGNLLTGDKTLKFVDENGVITELPDDQLWAKLATFGRDINTKREYKFALDEIKFQISRLKKGKRTVYYNGSDLQGDLRNVYKKVAESCTIQYTSRNGEIRTLNLEQIRQRLFAMSSDMYMCTDYRWGDKESGDLNCPEDKLWYQAQILVRGITDRQKAGASGLMMTLREMLSKSSGVPDLNSRIPDFEKFFSSVDYPSRGNKP